MKLIVTGAVIAGSILNHPFSFTVDTPDGDHKISTVPHVEFEFKDNGTDGIQVEATALSFLKVKRTLVTPGPHDFSLHLGELAFTGTLDIEP